MTEKLIEYLANPAKSKIIIELMTKKRATAKELALVSDDLPQATLYRYLKKMVEDGVFIVAEERKVRNVTEKIYAMGIDFSAYTEKMLSENSGEAYLAMFGQFSAGLLNEFRTYTKRDDIDLLNDGSGFRIAPIYASLEELQELSASIWALVAPYQNRQPTPEQKARSVAVVFTPPTDVNK